MAARLAEKEKRDYKMVEKLLIEVDRMKSTGRLSDGEILAKAFHLIGSD